MADSRVNEVVASLRRVVFEARGLPRRVGYHMLQRWSEWRLSRREAGDALQPSTAGGPGTALPRVFDCITLFDGLDLLEIRLNVLNDHVDVFVIVEATTTHAGEPKPLYFAENRQRFAPFLRKVRHVVVEDMPKLQDVGHRHLLTSFQRDQIMHGLQDCRPDDIVYVSDFDEIPNPDVMPVAHELLRLGLERVRFQQRLYYYFLNGEITQDPWVFGTVATKFTTLQHRFDGRPDLLRPSEITPSALECIRLPNGGWHFSYLGGVEAVIRKISAFEMTALDRPDYKTPERVLQALEEGRDVFGRENCAIRYVAIDHTFPRHVRENVGQWAHLIRRPVSA